MAESIHKNLQYKKFYKLYKLCIPLLTSVYFQKAFPDVCFVPHCNLYLAVVFLVSGRDIIFPFCFAEQIFEDSYPVSLQSSLC